MAKWEAVTRLWSPSANRYFEPGELIELDGAIVSKLLRKGCIKPARYRRVMTEQEGNNDDSNNQFDLGRSGQS